MSKLPLTGCHCATFCLPYSAFYGKEFLHMYEVKEIFERAFPKHRIISTSGSIYPGTILHFMQFDNEIYIDFYCNQEGRCDIPAFPI